MLNEVPNNNEIAQVANIVLNEAPKSNDTKHIGNSVHFTATILNGGYIAIMQKNQLTIDER